jgi:hypothetical protein
MNVMHQRPDPIHGRDCGIFGLVLTFRDNL